MNNRGQSLITFVLILPLITMFLAFFIDSSLCIMEKNKIDGVITSNMQSSLNSGIYDTLKIKEAISHNISGDVKVDVDNDNLKIYVKSTKTSVFNKILNFSWYNFEFNYCGNYQDKKINKKCG